MTGFSRLKRNDRRVVGHAVTAVERHEALGSATLVLDNGTRVMAACIDNGPSR